jgi:PleD family two-component response regulator
MENLVPGLNSNREAVRSTPATEKRSILLIDNAHRDRRRERAAALNNAGYRVHPARSFPQSLSRLGSGSYDLVIANADGAAEDAAKFCADVKRNFPRQRLLAVKAANTEIQSEVDFRANDPKSLLDQVREIMEPAARPDDHAIAA